MNHPATDLRALRRAEHERVRNIHLVSFATNARFEKSHASTGIFLLVADPSSPLARVADFDGFEMGGMIRRVAVAVGKRGVVVAFRGGRTRQRGNIASGWSKPTRQRIREEFVREREYIARVRDVDRGERTFTVVLGGLEANPNDELLATFRLRMLDDDQVERLVPGSVFRVVTGYRRTVDDAGRVLKSSLDTRLFPQEARPLTLTRREKAWQVADHLYADD